MTDVYAVVPVYERSTSPTYPKLIDVSTSHFSPDKGHDYAATLAQFYDPENNDPIGYGATATDAISDLRDQILGLKFSGPELAALEGWLAHLMMQRPEGEREGWRNCINELLGVFE